MPNEGWFVVHKLVAVALVVLGSACADEESLIVGCPAIGYNAVHVQVAGEQPVVAVTATHDDMTRPCDVLRQEADASAAYGCIEMGGGEYVITVHAGEQRWVERVQVKLTEDACPHPELADVTVDLSTEPAGPAELTACSDGSGRGDCCRDASPQSPCSTPMLYCVDRCDLPSAEAKTGKLSSYTCSDGRWTSNAVTQCVRPGVGKEDL